MKRFVSLCLAVLMLVSLWGVLPVSASDSSTLPDHVIINQAYAASDNLGSISHGFVELYNPTDQDIDLSPYSLQYAAGRQAWSQALPLNGYTIKARHSLLIRGMGYGGTPRYTIPNIDIDWGIPFSNRNFTFALVTGLALLANATLDAADWARVIDLVGAVNDPGAGDGVNNWEGDGFVDGISKQKPCRRIKFADFDDNAHDFEILDYRATGISDARVQEVRPRWSGDGQWGLDIFPDPWINGGDLLSFSHQGGRYSAPFTLTLTTALDGGVIRYTADGSDPTNTSPVFPASMNIADRSGQPNVVSRLPSNPGNKNPAPNAAVAKGTVVKARVYTASGTAVSDIVTQSYFVGLPAAYSTFPIVSLALDNGEMFTGSSGIYRIYDTKNEIPVHMSLFEPDNTGITQYMGIRIHGGWTRSYPQKSLRLYAKSGYDAGKNRLECDLFQGRDTDAFGEPITSYRRFLLRAGGNDNNSASGSTQVTMMRDSILHTLAEGLNFGRQAYRSSAVFINGEFWGLYNIRPRIDEYFVQDTFNISNVNNIAIFSFGLDDAPLPEEVVEDPTPTILADWDDYMAMFNWFSSKNDLTSPADYTKAQTYIDIDNLIDYFGFEIFVGNEDWPASNNVMWRYRKPYPSAVPAAGVYEDGRWRYILKDLDMAFDNKNALAMNDGLNRILYHQSGTRLTPESTLIFRKFMSNTDFVKRFANRMCDLMNFQLSEANIKAAIDEAQTTIQPLMQAQLNRWSNIYKTVTLLGEYNVPYGSPSIDAWNGGFDYLRNVAGERQGSMLGQMKASKNKLGLPKEVTLTLQSNLAEGRLSLNGHAIGTANWSGKYFPGITQKITASPQPGYAFSHFLVDGETRTANPLPLTLTGNATVQAVYQVGESNPDVTQLGNKTNLVNRLTEIINTPKWDYTDESWNLFQLVLGTAFSAANNPSATQAEVDDALNALNAAFANLQLKTYIFSTKYESSFWSWIMFICLGGWAWMWL